MYKPFVVYRSSAGSGKTRSLAKEYLKLALTHRADYFKHILAVTFTNKATQEMKDRILQYLVDFSKGTQNELAAELQRELELDADTFLDRCKETLTLLLHNYSRFGISTIDAFFQRVIRSFTRESGLMGNFRLEVDNDLLLEQVVNNLLDDLGKDEDITRWVLDFSRARLHEGASWNITYSLVQFAKEILKEDFKLIENEIIATDKATILRVLNELKAERKKFMDAMGAMGREALTILNEHALGVDDFSNGNNGTAFSFFNDFANGVERLIGARIISAVNDPKAWVRKTELNRSKLYVLAQGVLGDLLKRMFAYHEAHYPLFNSVSRVLSNFYEYALIADIVKKISIYKAENNVMLLADASKLLNGIIDKSDTPFIYEKAGSFYQHFLIDEFQDTSVLQWKNFSPLLKDSLDSYRRNMVVGDVKQSIYRWRGSDLRLLKDAVPAEMGLDRTEFIPLLGNYRSAGHVVEFNNLFFNHAAFRVSEMVGNTMAKEAYADVAQKNERLPGEGFVRLRFFEQWSSTGKKEALEEMMQFVEEIQEKGHAPSDIAILVRENREGQEVANFFLQYQSEGRAKEGCRYEIVSNDSLRLDSALSVALMVMALRVINNPKDKAAQGEFTLALARWRGEILPGEKVAISSKGLEHPLTPEIISGLASLPIDEVVEALIRFFDLASQSPELVYLLAFQEVVLEFAGHEKNDIGSFLDWWELNKNKKSVQSSDKEGAIRIITIHKAKGLQFKFVFVPFGDWKLDHDRMPILWCKSSEKPFDALGHVAVRYSKDLANSFFAAAYEEERTKVHLDNLNLLYVAFTRAELGLLFFGPKDRNGNSNYAGSLACNVVTVEPSLAKTFSDDQTLWMVGRIPDKMQGVQKPSEVSAIQLLGYQSFAWREKLVIRTEGTEFFVTEKSEQRQKINYGILLHKILSRVTYKDESHEVVKQLASEGVIMQAELEEVEPLLAAMWQHPVVSGWFSKEWTVKTEAPLLVPQHRPERIDRVMFRESAKGKKKAVIVDYKSGLKKESDKAQVLAYAQHLQQMGYEDVEGFLLYLMPLEVVPVMSKSALTLF